MDSAPPEAACTIPADLVARAAKGDRQALADLYDRSSPLLFTLALRILGDRHEAGALLQEVYLDLWRKSLRYDPGRGAPIAWLAAAVRTRALERVRARPARSGEERPREEGGAAAEYAKPDRELHELVGRAVERLDEDRRRAIDLAYFGGLSAEEIATRTGAPVETVKASIRAGMAELKSVLRPALDGRSADEPRGI